MDDPFKQHAEAGAALLGVMLHRMGNDSSWCGFVRVTAPPGYAFPTFCADRKVPFVHVANYERALYWMERLTRE